MEDVCTYSRQGTCTYRLQTQGRLPIEGGSNYGYTSSKTTRPQRDVLDLPYDADGVLMQTSGQVLETDNEGLRYLIQSSAVCRSEVRYSLLADSRSRSCFIADVVHIHIIGCVEVEHNNDNRRLCISSIPTDTARLDRDAGSS